MLAAQGLPLRFGHAWDGPKEPEEALENPEVKRFTSSAEPHVTIASLGDSVFDLCEEGT
jgi:hypothetical protein